MNRPAPTGPEATMKLSSTLPVLTLAFALAAPIALMARNDAAKLPNGPTADEATTAKLVYGLLSDSRYAYRPRALDDALSQDIFKRYLEALDPGKLFFTAEDIKNFSPTQRSSTTRSRAARWRRPTRCSRCTSNA